MRSSVALFLEGRAVSKNEKIYDFETGSLHILLMDGIMSVVKWFQKMKKIQLLKVGVNNENHYEKKISGQSYRIEWNS